MRFPILSELCIVVVDDSRHMRKLLATMLNALEITNVLVAENGAQALEFVRSGKADILITDADMQPMSGLDIAKTLRASADRNEQSLPIIMVTGRAERSWVEAARDAGVNEFIAKPVSLNVLHLRIAEVVMRPRAFISAQSFAGPDRRRKDPRELKGPRRRKVDRSAAN